MITEVDRVIRQAKEAVAGEFLEALRAKWLGEDVQRVLTSEARKALEKDVSGLTIKTAVEIIRAKNGREGV